MDSTSNGGERKKGLSLLSGMALGGIKFGIEDTAVGVHLVMGGIKHY